MSGGGKKVRASRRSSQTSLRWRTRLRPCRSTISGPSRPQRNKAAPHLILQESSGSVPPALSRSCVASCRIRYGKKKGPLASDASGPSLGRKRPRRAAIAQSATASQQYATALHKVQVLSNSFPRKVPGHCRRATLLLHDDYICNFKYLYDKMTTCDVNRETKAKRKM